MNHLEFAALESAALIETDWERWAGQVENILGHNLDGDEYEDGYSMDGAYEAYQIGERFEDYANRIR